MLPSQLRKEDVSYLRALVDHGEFTAEALGLWLGVPTEDARRVLADGPRSFEPWELRGVAEASAAAEFRTSGVSEARSLGETDMGPEQAAALCMGRCFAAAVERGHVYSDMHPGNFLFDGEYGVISDIGDDVAGGEPAVAAAHQLTLLEPSWGDLFAPFATGCLLALQGCWGWESAPAMSALSDAVRIRIPASTVQGSSSTVLSRVQGGQWAPAMHDQLHWIAAIAALRLCGHSLDAQLLRTARDWMRSPEFSTDPAASTWLEASLTALTGADLLRNVRNFLGEPAADGARRLLELLIVGYMYRFLHRSLWRATEAQLLATQLMPQLLHAQLRTLSPEEAEAELNALAPLRPDAWPAASFRLQLAADTAAAANDLLAFELSLRECAGGKPAGLLWSLAWRALHVLRGAQERVERSTDAEQFPSARSELLSLVTTHAAAVERIQGAIRQLEADGSWSAWTAASRKPPNLDSERAWLDAAQDLLERGAFAQFREHWRALPAHVNLEIDPLRILRNAQTTDGEKIPWRELDARWNSPVIVPIVRQRFPWHREPPKQEGSETWPVPEELARHPTVLDAPVFEYEQALRQFSRSLFDSIKKENFPDESIPVVAMRSDRDMVSLRAGNLLFFAFDVGQVEASASFFDRVREPVRRPPAALASVAVSQRILAHDVWRIKISAVGGWQRSDTMDVGWYLAGIEMPESKDPHP